MVAIPEKIRKYIIKGPIRTISKNAPDEIKQEAREIDSSYYKYSGKHIFIIQE